jgi:hypothetical protein
MSGSLLVLLFEGHRGQIGFLAAAVLIIRLRQKGSRMNPFDFFGKFCDWFHWIRAAAPSGK